MQILENGKSRLNLHMFDKCSDFRIQYIEAKIYVSSLQGTSADVTMKVEAITSKKNRLPYNPSLIIGQHFLKGPIMSKNDDLR